MIKSIYWYNVKESTYIDPLPPLTYEIYSINYVGNFNARKVSTHWSHLSACNNLPKKQRKVRKTLSTILSVV